jgi:hypothetical protein
MMMATKVSSKIRGTYGLNILLKCTVSAVPLPTPLKSIKKRRPRKVSNLQAARRRMYRDMRGNDW